MLAPMLSGQPIASVCDFCSKRAAHAPYTLTIVRSFVATLIRTARHPRSRLFEQSKPYTSGLFEQNKSEDASPNRQTVEKLIRDDYPYQSGMLPDFE